MYRKKVAFGDALYEEMCEKSYDFSRLMAPCHALSERRGPSLLYEETN